jgi:tRNA dimethylallyltransferase
LKNTLHNHLIVIAGPTASGKTALAIDLALHFNCEIISADSRQFYKEISIGTAKPSEEELKKVKHHFINNKHIEELYSAGEFEKDVIALLPTLFTKNNIVIMAGGSGMYIDAVCNGFDELPRNISIRNELNNLYKIKGISTLQEELKSRDPDCFLKIDQKNPQRLIRALEICRITNQPYSKLLTKKKEKRPFQIHKVAIKVDKDLLKTLIDKRVNQMINKGLEDEAIKMFKKQNLNSLNTVGYKEFFEHFKENTKLEKTIENIKTNTKKYAKRQVTWLKRNNDYFWIKSTPQKERLNDVLSHLKKRIK